MNLNMDQWKEFRIGDIFECSTTKLSIKDELDIGNIPLISRTAMNNGCDGYFDIDPQKVSKGGCITIGAEGIYAFYQAKDFGTGNKVYTIKNKEMNQYSALFICTLLNKEGYKYSYGRARILGKLINETIKLPVNPEGNPDREFMENYIKSLHSKPITTKNKPGKNVLHTDEWKEFRLGKLFDIDTGKDFIYNEAEGNDFIVIGHGIDNNGIACKTEYLDNYKLYDHKATLSLGHIGNFIAYVQPSDFYLGTRTKALKTKEELSIGALLFVSTIINQQSYKFSYGRVGSDKIPDLEIKLPIKDYLDKDCKYSEEGYIPDREYMENYIKNLPYGDRI